ncbi:hypothetical protein MNVM_27610 [Mycobacterium novum]|uniref:Uncharacterized protein n=1 Tax=Mycobacterium novum TaxID=2492438 RepID=A0A7I7JPB9_9MYCO|nr:hypothetical protein MNVM_27610 [Mycobacterium novum]
MPLVVLMVFRVLAVMVAMVVWVVAGLMGLPVESAPTVRTASMGRRRRWRLLVVLGARVRLVVPAVMVVLGAMVVRPVMVPPMAPRVLVV